MRRRRRKLLPAPPPPRYVTLAEVQARGGRVDFDRLAPKDRVKVAQRYMGPYDDLPPEVRRAIDEATWKPLLKIRCADRSVMRLDYAHWAVILIDNGLSCAQVVERIRQKDAEITARRRKDGTLPPEGPAVTT